MQLSLDPRPLLPDSPALDADEVQRLRELPYAYAKAIEDEPGAPDIATLIAEARALAPAAEGGYADALVRRANVLEEAEIAFDKALRLLERARALLEPSMRVRVAEHATTLAAIDFAGAPSDVRSLHRAAAWISQLDVTTAARALDAIRRERHVLEANDLRCRAFHATRSLVRRVRERPRPS